MISCSTNWATLSILFVTPVGFEPTVDFRHLIKSQNRSTSTETESLVPLVGFEPTMDIRLLVKSQLLSASERQECFVILVGLEPTVENIISTG